MLGILSAENREVHALPSMFVVHVLYTLQTHNYDLGITITQSNACTYDIYSITLSPIQLYNNYMCFTKCLCMVCSCACAA